MKKKMLFFIALCFVGLTSANAAPFRIGDVEYDTLKAAVEDVPKDGTKTTIVLTEDVDHQPGVQTVAGQNVVIDFGGHKYEASAPFTGSANTVNQEFQLLKGSTVYMKNGDLYADGDSGCAMFIQNYSNLTLENIHIDTTKNSRAGFYALSSNYGEVYLIGNTSIKVNETPSLKARAFDMCWAPKIGSGSYKEGTQIVVETEGEINGYIELDVWGTFDNTDGIKSTLEIKNIDFHGKWMMDSRLSGQLTIDGGKYLNPGITENTSQEYFANHPEYIDIREYLKDGNASYNLGEHFWVLPSKMVAYDNDVLFLIKGKEYNFAKNLPSGYEEYVKYDIADKTVISIENNIIKGLKDGTSNITVTLGETKTGAITKTFLAVVKDLSEATDYQANANEGEAVINVMNVIVGNVIQKAIDDNDSESIDATTRANLIEALENGKNVDAKLDVKIVKESDLDSTLVNKIKKSVINGTVVEFLDIDLLLTANDDLIGKINKLDDKLTISIDAPESLKNIPANTTRQFFIVRTHEGEEPEVIEATLKDGKLIFQTDKFSNYAVGYADTTNTINPNTLDTINFYGILFVVSLIALYLFKCKRNA